MGGLRSPSPRARLRPADPGVTESSAGAAVARSWSRSDAATRAVVVRLVARGPPSPSEPASGPGDCLYAARGEGYPERDLLLRRADDLSWRTGRQLRPCQAVASRRLRRQRAGCARPIPVVHRLPWLLDLHVPLLPPAAKTCCCLGKSLLLDSGFRVRQTPGSRAPHYRAHTTCRSRALGRSPQAPGVMRDRRPRSALREPIKK